jgi:hypothetical protein
MRRGRRRARGIVLGAALLGVVLVPPARAETRGWVEDFGQGRLDPATWERTVAGDFREWSADVVEADRPAPPRFRLRLRADTRGTRDDTVKYLGVRSVQPIPLRDDTRISVQLDWGDQANGSYLTGAVVVSPHATRHNPLDTADWLRVAYVGVPPGRNARRVVGLKTDGRERTVHTEGWPEVNPGGRPVAEQEITLRVRDRSFEVWEGRQRIWVSKPGELLFGAVYLYLQMSSHSNYPARSIYFDGVRVD